jgi:hypothetical protein
VLAAVAERSGAGIRQEPPREFPFRVHADRTEDKQRFDALLERLRAEDP